MNLIFMAISETGARRKCYFMAKDIPPFRAAHIIRIIQR
jgi:hypothetical protein